MGLCALFTPARRSDEKLKKKKRWMDFCVCRPISGLAAPSLVARGTSVGRWTSQYRLQKAPACRKRQFGVEAQFPMLFPPLSTEATTVLATYCMGFTVAWHPTLSIVSPVKLLICSEKTGLNFFRPISYERAPSVLLPYIILRSSLHSPALIYYYTTTNSRHLYDMSSLEFWGYDLTLRTDHRLPLHDVDLSMQTYSRSCMIQLMLPCGTSSRLICMI